MNLALNVTAETVKNILPVNQNNQTNDEGKPKQLAHIQHVESIAEEYKNLFENNKAWKTSVLESLDKTEQHFKSMEDDVEFKYKRLFEIGDLLVDKENELESRIKVITVMSKT